MKIIKTNLGKWKYEFQSYHEHVETVWVFRQLLLSPLFQYLVDQIGNIDDIKDDLKKIFRIETLYHDYDKLYIESGKVANLTSFKWHADITSNENQTALNALMADSTEEAFALIDGDLFEDENQVREFLKNANVAHDGRLTDTKWENAKIVYTRLFKSLLGNDFDTVGMDVITNWLCYSIRVADSIASSPEDSISYKSDVSKFADLVRHSMPNAHVYIHSISFNTVFAESSSATVLQGYYTLYDAVYKALIELLEIDGVIIIDNSRTIVGLQLSEKNSDDFNARFMSKLHEKLEIQPQIDSVESIFQVNSQMIDMFSNITTYDVVIKETLLNQIFSVFSYEPKRIGYACTSCGRSIILEGKSSDEVKSKSESLDQETTSLESRGDFGTIRNISSIILETKKQDRQKNKLFVCDDCMTIASCVKVNKLIQKFFTTISISELERSYKTTHKELNLTNKAGKELQTAILPKLIYGFKRKQDLLNRIKGEVQINPNSINLIAGSFIILEYTNTPQKMYNNFIEPLLKCLEPICIDLPDGQLIYEANFGIRIGTGPMFYENQIIDNEFLKGLFKFSEYASCFNEAKELNNLLSKMDNEIKENAVLVSSLNTSMLPSLIKELLKIDALLYKPRDKKRFAPKLMFEEVVELATYIQEHPDSIAYLRQVKNANKVKPKKGDA